MITSEWSDMLFSAYREHRDSIGWADLYELHDGEDQQCFMAWDELYGR